MELDRMAAMLSRPGNGDTRFERAGPSTAMRGAISIPIPISISIPIPISISISIPLPSAAIGCLRKTPLDPHFPVHDYD
jgi:hypothetical protein